MASNRRPVYSVLLTICLQYVGKCGEKIVCFEYLCGVRVIPQFLCTRIHVNIGAGCLASFFVPLQDSDEVVSEVFTLGVLWFYGFMQGLPLRMLAIHVNASWSADWDTLRSIS